jgi:hypothetical protein
VFKLKQEITRCVKFLSERLDRFVARRFKLEQNINFSICSAFSSKNCKDSIPTLHLRIISGEFKCQVQHDDELVAK